MLSDYKIIMISCIHANIVYTLQTAETTRARKDFSAGAVHYTMYLSVKHFSLRRCFCCGGICHKLSFRQQGFMLNGVARNFVWGATRLTPPDTFCVVSGSRPDSVGGGGGSSRHFQGSPSADQIQHSVGGGCSAIHVYVDYGCRSINFHQLRQLPWLRHCSYAIDVTLPVDIRRDFTSQVTRNNTITADNVLENECFTDNYVDNIRTPVIDIANLSTILYNDLTDFSSFLMTSRKLMNIDQSYIRAFVGQTNH